MSCSRTTQVFLVVSVCHPIWAISICHSSTTNALTTTGRGPPRLPCTHGSLPLLVSSGPSAFLSLLPIITPIYHCPTITKPVTAPTQEPRMVKSGGEARSISWPLASLIVAPSYATSAHLASAAFILSKIVADAAATFDIKGNIVVVLNVVGDVANDLFLPWSTPSPTVMVLQPWFPLCLIDGILLPLLGLFFPSILAPTS